MHPIPGRISVFFVGKGAGRIFFRSQWLLLLLPLRCGDFRLSALSAYNNIACRFWFAQGGGLLKKIWSKMCLVKQKRLRLLFYISR